MRDQTRNIETFKVGSNKIDEFAFHKHQGEMHEQPGGERGQVVGRARTRAEQVEEVVKQAHEKVKRRKKRR
jgi:hypothetical protein